LIKHTTGSPPTRSWPKGRRRAARLRAAEGRLAEENDGPYAAPQGALAFARANAHQETMKTLDNRRLRGVIVRLERGPPFATSDAAVCGRRRIGREPPNESRASFAENVKRPEVLRNVSNACLQVIRSDNRLMSIRLIWSSICHSSGGKRRWRV
jgi:hypothetical protein